MKIIKRLVNFLDTDQISVIARDQPVYALEKEDQQIYPSHCISIE